MQGGREAPGALLARRLALLARRLARCSPRFVRAQLYVALSVRPPSPGGHHFLHHLRTSHVGWTGL